MTLRKINKNMIDDELIKQVNDTTQQLAETAKKSAPIVSVKEFEKYVVGGDWTLAVQSAFNAATRKVFFPPDGTVYSFGKVYINKDLEIDLMGNPVEGLAEALFCVNDNINYLNIKNCGGVTFASALGVQGREFFTNYSRGLVFGENITYFPQGLDIEKYSVKQLIIEDNVLGYAKVTILGDDTVPFIKRNRWNNESSIRPAPYYLYVSKGEHDVPYNLKPNVWIQDNTFEVYPPDSVNYDIIKITGGVKNAKISENYIHNKNKGCSAQVDVYSGAHRMKFVNNSLINVQLHRKQVKGSSSQEPHNYYYDYISGNDTEIQDGHSLGAAYYLIGSLFTVVGNQIDFKNSSLSDKTGFSIDRSGELVGHFLLEESHAFILSQNIVDFRGSGGKCYFANYSTSSDGSLPKYISVSNNIMLGGNRFQRGTISFSSVMGNIWADSSLGEGTSFSNLKNGVMLGNVSDTNKAILNAKTLVNRVPTIIPKTTVTGSMSIDVEGVELISVDGGGVVTEFNNGITGQELTLVSSGAGATVTHSSKVFLNGATSLTLKSRSTLTVLCTGGDVWVEISRSIVNV